MNEITIAGSGWSYVKECLRAYWGETAFLGIFMILMIYFLYKKRKEHDVFVYYVFFLIFTVYNPLAVRIVIGKMGYESIYYRFFWLVPVNIILAYAAVRIVSKTKELVRQMGIVLLLILFILITGAPLMQIRDLKLPDNLYKVEDDVLAVCELIHDDTEKENPRVATDMEMLLVMRQYDPSIQLTLSRDKVLYINGNTSFNIDTDAKSYKMQKAIVDVLYNGNYSNPGLFKQALYETDTEYLVFKENPDTAVFVENQGCTGVASAGRYLIYRVPEDRNADIRGQLAELFGDGVLVDMNEETIEIPGLTQEYRFVLINDSNVIIPNDEILPEEEEIVEERRKVLFVNQNGVSSEEIFAQVMEQVKQMDIDGLLLGGDIIDYMSTSNIDFLTTELSGLQVPYMYVRANHDYGREYTAFDETIIRQKEELLGWNQPVYVMDFPEFVIMGINFNTSQLTEEALAQIRNVWAMNKPVIVLTHVPYEPEDDEALGELSKQTWENRKLMWGKTSYYKPKDSTQEFVNMLYADSSPVQAVLAGHLHFEYTGMLNEKVTQYILPPAYEGKISVITVKGTE